MIVGLCVIPHTTVEHRVFAHIITNENSNEAFKNLQSGTEIFYPGTATIFPSVAEYIRQITQSSTDGTRGGKTFVFSQYGLCIVRWRKDTLEMDPLVDDINATIGLEFYWRSRARIDDETTRKLAIIECKKLDATEFPANGKRALQINFRGHNLGSVALNAILGQTKPATYNEPGNKC